jgi:hypothetical protein
MIGFGGLELEAGRPSRDSRHLHRTAQPARDVRRRSCPEEEGVPRALLLVPALLLVTGACSSDAGRDDAGQAALRADVPSSRLGVGDCIAGRVEPGVDRLVAVPCDRAHGAEAYDAWVLPYRDHPGDEPLATAAEQGCVARFEAFVGEAYERSGLDIASLTPTDDAWEAGDRTVVCFVTDPDRQTTGTLRSAAR